MSLLDDVRLMYLPIPSGDGVTDDTEALQKWLDVTGSLPPESVSDSKFLINGALRIKSNVKISGK